MSTQLENLKRQNERLKDDLDRKRVKTSEACKDLIQYTEQTEEPLHPTNSKSPNPFRAKGGSSCNII